MKYEELRIRAAYDREYRWTCFKCSKPLSNADIRWGNWRNSKGFHKDLSRCCNANIRARV